MTNPILPSPCEILSVKQESTYEYTYRVKTEFKAKHGQFLQLSIPKVGEAPISVSAQGEDWLEFTLRPVGKVTNEIFAKKAGDTLFLRGPYGNGWPVEQLKGKHLVFITGGTGLAPVRSLLNTCAKDKTFAKSVSLISGFKNEDSIVFKEDLENWKDKFQTFYTLDNDKKEGWNTGLVTGFIKDIDFDGGRPKMGEMGVVFQRYALFPWKTVIENVDANQRFKGVKKAQRRKDAEELIKLVGLEGFENSYPAALSGGMKQRVGIARAYATKADIMLMDEPFGALDAQTRYQMQDEILRIWQTNKTTVVFITNNIEEAVYLGDRIVLLGNKPSKVVKEFVIDMPRPRNNLSHEFLELRNEIADNMDLSLV